MADNHLFTAEQQLKGIKWSLFLLIFIGITFLLNLFNFTPGTTPGHAYKYMWFFAIMCFIIVLSSSLIRDYSSEEEDDGGEGFFEFLPNIVSTSIWFIYMGSVLAFKLSEEGGKSTPKFKDMLGINTSGIDSVVSGSQSGGANQVSITIDKTKDAAIILQILGIIAVILNVASNLYIYYTCEDGGCPTENHPMIRSLVSAQFNIITISILAIGIFTFHKKHA
jgi:hypothetical protein